MATRAARPPALAGYEFVELIGQGGFADVFLYQQARPARRVAVKVLLETNANAPERRRFDAEADVMAQLSSHPSIVSIYQADVARDGRAFLVMEYCPKPNLALRSRRQSMTVPETLEVAIRISGAVETAHRAGILHRDIKPHNILVDAYDQPKLTDFGIAVTSGAAGDHAGMSVPWSPPEMFGEDPPNDPRSDVYSLAATVYTLLAGRSPFEIPGDNNDNHSLMTRIERAKPTRPGRADLDDRLWEALARSLSANPANRHQSAIAFARAMQDAQIALHLTPTKIDVLDAGHEAEAPGAVQDDARTSVRPIAIIEQSPETGGVSALGDRPSRPSEDTSMLGPRRVAAEPNADTLARPAVLGATPDPRAAAFAGSTSRTHADAESAATPGSPRSGLRIRPPAVLGLVGVAAAVAATIVLLSGGEQESPVEPGNLGDTEPGVAVADIPAPPEIGPSVIRNGRAVFSWDNPDPRPQDRYRWRVSDGSAPPTETTTPRARVPLGEEGTVCISVQTLRDGSASLESTACAPGGLE
jgi:serine/threonine protein kinase